MALLSKAVEPERRVLPRVLISKPVALAQGGFGGEWSRLSVQYDLGRAMSLAEDGAFLYQAPLDRSSALQGELTTLQRGLREQWGGFEERQAATRFSLSERVQTLAGQLANPDLSVEQAISLVRTWAATVQADPPPIAPGEQAAYEAALRAADAERVRMSRELYALTRQINQATFGYCVVAIGEPRAIKPPTGPAYEVLTWPWEDAAPDYHNPDSFDARAGGLFPGPVVDWIASTGLALAREQLTGPLAARP